MNLRASLLAFLVSYVAASAQDARNAHASRYAFAPSGYSIPKDSAYLNVVGPLVDFQIGITDHFSAGIGTPLLLGVYGTASYGLELAPNVRAKVGALAGVPVVGSGSFALPFAVGTYGSPGSNVSLGLGYVSVRGENLPDIRSGIAYNLSGYQAFGARFGFTAELWHFAAEDVTAVLPALRIYSRRSISYFNVGFLNALYPKNQPTLLGYDTNFDGIVDTQDPYLGGVAVLDYLNLTRVWERLTLPAFTFAYYL